MNNRNLIDLTDEDILSSLKVIATTRNCNECKIRNCKWGTCNCEQITANAALDLINRQKSEIERLKGSAIVNNIMEIQRIKRETKAETYKEFAERIMKKIEETCSFIDNGICARTLIFTEDIDKILKEMVGKE